MEMWAAKEWRFVAETKDNNAIETYVRCLTYFQASQKTLQVSVVVLILQTRKQTLRGYTFSSERKRRKGNEIKVIGTQIY